MSLSVDRRTLLAGGAALMATPAFAQNPAPVLTKPIPVSGEQLPVVGIGTARIMDFESDPEAFAERRQVLEILASGQTGNIIDTAPSYGRAEDVLGELFEATGLRDSFFLATKTRAGRSVEDHIAEMERSKARLRTDHFELMQYHNVSDPNQDFGLLREWKSEGICKYVGMTSTFEQAYDSFVQVLRSGKPDFVQVDYAIDNRSAEERILPAAMENGAAVLTALPFGRNRLFQRTADVPLPDFAAEIGAETWAQFFLKFLISHPAVNAVIPGTDLPQYMRDNLGAGRAPMPDQAMRARMAAFIDNLPG